MKRLLFLAPLLSLTACTGAEVATTGASVAGLFLGARPVASTVAMNQRELDAANKRADEANYAAKMASRRGVIPPTQDQDTARPNFCEMVVTNLAIITDMAGKASELICRMDHHLDLAEHALKNHLASSYAENLAKADSYTSELTALIRKADEGAPQ